MWLVAAHIPTPHTNHRVLFSLSYQQGQKYSCIENGKTDPSFTIVTKIAKALGVSLAELFEADSIFTDVKSADKTLMEKLRLIDTLVDQEKQSLFNIVDSLVVKKKLKDNLTNVL